ncbi:chorismate lyase [Candidatus Berkiella aquae]|uniref:Probable chorismate pyruvate-lyase n=1 Tax=Candidatus Berkiella aquae TaxID=295108 RepID=A0A0Q9YKT8_9GAMM|nr:chorismate lyase [Candidatus Berkiella aquae]MCS5710923.1 chorismate lyase [Candidatus Berkiella aquae]
MKSIQWESSVAALQTQPSPSIENWLTQPYILSHALKRHCQHLGVQVLAQQFAAVDATEQTLSEQGALPFVRQVFLCGDDVPWTYGRVVIAPSTYQSYFTQFASLGSKPLGETLLYNNPDTTRSRFEYALITQDTPLYREIQAYLSLTEPMLWGRRSYFYLKQFPLLVTEVFLPMLPSFKP